KQMKDTLNVPETVITATPRPKRKKLRLRLIIPAVLLLAIIMAAIFAPLIAPFEPNAQNLQARLLPPIWQSGSSPEHLLGTDDLGRDILSRILYGARISLMVGTLAVFFRLVSGLIIGLIAGYFGGPIRAFFMRLGDVQLALPTIVLAIGIIAALGPSVT